MSLPFLDYLTPSFELHLRAEAKARSTIRIYVAAVRQFAEWIAAADPSAVSWDRVTRDHVRAWSVDLIDRTSAGNASVQWRALQQFLKWAELEGEIAISPMRDLSGPRPAPPPVPVIELADLQRLLATCAGTSFVDRRDEAILRLFIDTGIRRGEIVGPRLDDVRLYEREAVVTGKGSRVRIVRFGAKTARALDRYLRRRAQQAGLGHIHPHQFRHTFAHLWLDQGGAEGDLMELAGWTSRQMLTRYGASARSARARRSYDRIELGDRL
ncbi:MAG: integrase/recombinase XerC [Pseudonocardiales bacterium]|nr:integrase/recombinase XerC [Pseudonocardiales bacterium]